MILTSGLYIVALQKYEYKHKVILKLKCVISEDSK